MFVEESINIRKSNIEDCKQIKELIIHGFNLRKNQFYDSDVMYEIVNSVSFVVEKQGVILGYICGSNVDEYEELLDIVGNNYGVAENVLKELSITKYDLSEVVEIRNLIVSEDLRGMGYGSKLLKSLLLELETEKYIVVGMERTKTGKWDAETIIKKEGFNLLEKIENMWLNESKLDCQECDKCIKPELNNDKFGCYCTASVWLHK